MRGSGLTRYSSDYNQGGSGFKSFANGVVRDIAASALGEAQRDGWKSLKSGGPLGLPSLFAGVQGVKRGAIRGAKRGAKRKATSALNHANKTAKRAVDDLFG